MSPREVADIPRLIDGDRVTDGRNYGYARTCTNRSTGKTFINVFIYAGPRKDSWATATMRDLFAPILDHEGGTVGAVCERCDRAFLATARVLEGFDGKRVAREPYCRTCWGYGRTVEDNRARADGFLKGWNTPVRVPESVRSSPAPARPVDDEEYPF